MTIEERSTTKNKYNITSWPEFGVNYWGIPKCMNTSIKIIFLRELYEAASSNIKTQNTYQFAHHQEVDRYITPEEANTNGNTNFTIVREPIGRIISMYKDFTYKRPEIGRHIKDLSISIDEGMCFRKFVKRLNELDDETCNIHLASQSSLIHNAKNITILPMDIGKVKEFMKSIGIEGEIPYVNATPDLAVRVSLYDEKIIRQRYKDDFDLPY